VHADQLAAKTGKNFDDIIRNASDGATMASAARKTGCDRDLVPSDYRSAFPSKRQLRPQLETFYFSSESLIRVHGENQVEEINRELAEKIPRNAR
jgi:hypothetical protein